MQREDPQIAQIFADVNRICANLRNLRIIGLSVFLSSSRLRAFAVFICRV
jgi:hypothetical protein